MLENLDQLAWKGRCKIQRIGATLSTEDKTLLMDYLGDEQTWSHYYLTKALNKAGIIISETVIRRHRAKECACWRT
jgi:hypothetical protein